MFKLQLFDRKGNALKIGDIVKVSNGRDFTFFAEVKYLKDAQIITPFHTFSFHSFEKVDSVPENAVKCSEERYNVWYCKNAETDEEASYAEKYLTDWRQCEHLLAQRCYRITVMD